MHLHSISAASSKKHIFAVVIDRVCKSLIIISFYSLCLHHLEITISRPLSIVQDDHSVYHPLMSIADHEALMRRGSLSEMTSSGAGAPYTPPPGPMMSESHMAPDFCTIRRGARGPDITLGYPNTEITITGTRMNGDGLPNGNGIKHPINDRLI